MFILIPITVFASEATCLDCNGLYHNGFCDTCGSFLKATKNTNDYYEIGNAGQLYWFAEKVNNDNENYGSANAILTADDNIGGICGRNEGGRIFNNHYDRWQYYQ